MSFPLHLAVSSTRSRNTNRLVKRTSGCICGVFPEMTGIWVHKWGEEDHPDCGWHCPTAHNPKGIRGRWACIWKLPFYLSNALFATAIACAPQNPFEWTQSKTRISDSPGSIFSLRQEFYLWSFMLCGSQALELKNCWSLWLFSMQIAVADHPASDPWAYLINSLHNTYILLILFL